jgi:N-acyl-D-amino-acid deacylase
MTRRLAALLLVLVPAAARADDDRDALRAAVVKGLKRLEQGSANYLTKRQCFSCHHQALTVAAFASARRRGFEVDEAKFKAQVEFSLKSFKGKEDRIAKGRDIGGGNTTAAFALFCLESGGHAADETTAALVEHLLVRQSDDGSWPATTRRPPSEGSKFTTAALALRALKAYGPAKDAKDADELRKRIEKAAEKGRAWLLKNEPEDTEDKLWRLRALATAGAERKEIDAARDLLLKEQLKDGSWAQLPNKDGDAYATAAVLMALRTAGVEPGDEAYRKGVRWLLKEQGEHGGWEVQTRSRPVQVFFDNGDPGGKSQFISFLATGWATLALLEACPEK